MMEYTCQDCGHRVISYSLVAELEEAVRKLEPPFLALPERGETAETLAYRRGARDAYQAVIALLRGAADRV
jgi:hypothetical protein